MLHVYTTDQDFYSLFFLGGVGHCRSYFWIALNFKHIFRKSILVWPIWGYLELVLIPLSGPLSPCVPHVTPPPQPSCWETWPASSSTHRPGRSCPAVSLVPHPAPVPSTWGSHRACAVKRSAWGENWDRCLKETGGENDKFQDLFDPSVFPWFPLISMICLAVCVRSSLIPSDYDYFICRERLKNHAGYPWNVTAVAVPAWKLLEGPAWLQADTSAPIHDLTDVVGSIAATWCASSPLCAWFGRQTTRNFRSCRKRGIFGRRTSTKVSWKKDLAGLAKKFDDMVGSQQILDSVDRDGSNLSASLTFCLQMPAETASGTCDTAAHSEDGWIFHEAMGHLDWMPGLMWP